MANENYHIKTIIQRAIEQDDLVTFKRYCNKNMLNSHLEIFGYSLTTPVLLASRLGSEDILDYIFYSDAVNVQDLDNYGQNALMNSVHSRNMQMFRQVSLYVSFKEKDYEGNTCVHVAASVGAIEILRICIEEFVMTDSQNIYGQTALHMAETPEVIEYLIVQGGSDVNAQDHNGWSSLHYCVYKGLVDCARVLIQIGVDARLEDKTGATALDFAIENLPELVEEIRIEVEKVGNKKNHSESRKKNQELIEEELKNQQRLKESIKEISVGIKRSKTLENFNINYEKQVGKIVKNKEEDKVIEKNQNDMDQDAEILEVNSEGDEFPMVDSLMGTPLRHSAKIMRKSSSDSIKSQITPKIQTMISEIILKTPSDTISLLDFGVEMMKYEELRFRELLGHGAYGKVYRGYFRDSEVAIKVINTDKVDDRLAKEFIKEIECMVKIRHSRFLLLLGICIEGPLCIVTELSKGGNLAAAIDKRNLSKEDKLKIALQLAEGISYIHSKTPPIVHRDIKPQNILLDEYNQVKIADLGLSRAIEKVSNTEKINSTRVCAGTIRYMAPELYYEIPMCSRATDVWAYGCVLLHMFTGQPPWNGLELIAVQRRLILNEEFIINENLDPDIEILVKKCCTRDPDERISFKDIRKIILDLLGVQNSQQY
ncbi:hypothetical protein SteCoe_34007 [Stentor coeruleus]|uniref:Protein kinase domain-containing protein n=1 Tax=Stentor coeruleus TaxID=5963 RepID=A0A1R2AVF3_9CILI|nr:hypothetical protein SteCoe_34007 [Stentor coeruleus]